MFRQTTSNKLWGQVNGMTVNCKETGTPPALLPVVSPWLSCPLTSQNLISSVCVGGVRVCTVPGVFCHIMSTFAFRNLLCVNL